MRLKKKSIALEIAKRRFEGLKNIDVSLDLSNGLTLQSFKSEIESLESMIGNYNRNISEVDGMLSSIKAKERSLLDYRERMLVSVAGKYGKDSVEYVLAGGTRKSERKKPRFRMASSITQVEN